MPNISHKIKPVEKKLDREEKWLLRESKFLKEFVEDVEKLLQLQEKINAVNQAANRNQHANLNKKLGELREYLQKKEGGFKKLERIIGKGERRRVRYEKRVLGNLHQLENSLDQPTKKELNNLVEQIHIYSARSISEISLRAGKISKLIQEKTPSLEKIKKHLDVTLQASQALIVLLERLKSLIQKIEERLEYNELVHIQLPNLTGLNQFLRDGVIKTAAIKSIPAIRHILEKGMVHHMFFNRTFMKKSQYRLKKLIEKHQQYLSKYLTKEEMEELASLDVIVPPDATLFFMSRTFNNVLGNFAVLYNIKNAAMLQFNGWVVHSTQPQSLPKIAHYGYLNSPAELIRTVRNYSTTRAGRVLDGISLVWQNMKEYGGYMVNSKKEVGGKFVLPINEVLQEGLILDFGDTVDGRNENEVVLRDAIYESADSSVLYYFQKSFKTVKDLIEGYDKNLILFNLFKKNIKFFNEINSVIKDKYRYDQDKIRIYVEISLSNSYILRAVPRDDQPFTLSNENQDLLDILYKFNFGTSVKLFEEYIKAVDENNFYYFMFILSGFSYEDVEKMVTPVLTTYNSRNFPQYLTNTIFYETGYNFYYDASHAYSIITLAYKKKNGPAHIGEEYRRKKSIEYLHDLKKFPPKKILKTLKHTLATIAGTIQIIIPHLYVTKNPCRAPIDRSIFLTHYSLDQDIIKSLVKKNVIVIVFKRLEEDYMGKLEELVKKIFIFKDLGGSNPRKFQLAGHDNRSYFSQKGGKIYLKERKTGKVTRYV